MKAFRTTIILAVGLFLLDAFFLNQGFVSLLVVLFTLVLFYFRGRCGPIVEIVISVAFIGRKVERTKSAQT